MLIDTHVHLSDKRFDDDREEVIKGFAQNNLEKVITVGYDFNSSTQGFDLSQKYESVYVAIGVHPHDAENYTEEFEVFARSVAQNKKVVSIGEIGLDYYNNPVPKFVQKQVFVRQLQLADELKLPVIIHVRDAYQDAIDILKEYRHLLKHSGVMHCYGGSLELAQEVLKLGLYLGFDGPITFTNSNVADKVVKHLPKDKVLIETDCPYLAPHPYRGQRNEPKYVALVASKMSQVFEMDEQELIKQTNENAKNLFFKLK